MVVVCFFGAIIPRFRARNTKNWVRADTIAALIANMPSSPATEPPPRVLKKVTAAVMEASIRAFSQSNLCFVTFLSVLDTKNPWVVKVQFLRKPKLPTCVRKLFREVVRLVNKLASCSGFGTCLNVFYLIVQKQLT